MTPEQFRKIALSLPEVSELSHQGHPDFRVGGKVFATLSFPKSGIGMVVLSPQEQRMLTQWMPEVFTRAQGAWGVRGCTYVQLKSAKPANVRPALIAAWRNKAPKRLAKRIDAQ